MHISNHTAPNKHILDAAEVGVFDLVDDLDVVELDVQVLVYGLEGATDCDVVF